MSGVRRSCPRLTPAPQQGQPLSGKARLVAPKCAVDTAHPLLPRRKPSDKRNTLLRHAPVAQLDRAPPSEGGGHTFESCRVRHFN